MSFKSHEGLGQVASSGGGATVPWWAVSQLLYGEPAASPEAETRRGGQFEVVPRAQGILDPSSAPKSGAPEVLKFSMFPGETFLPVCGMIAKFW